MKKLIDYLKLGVGFSAALTFAGCNIQPGGSNSSSSPSKRLFTTITCGVEGANGIDHADIQYGDEKVISGNTNTWLYTNILDTPLPREFTNYTCTTHPFKISATTLQSGKLTLYIKDNGKLVEETNFSGNFLVGGSLEYNIPSN